MKVKFILILFLLILPRCISSQTISFVDIEVEGTKTLSKKQLEEVKNAITTKEKEELSMYKISKDINNIYKLGYFADVTVKSLDVEDGGIKLVFVLKENPRIYRISFEGNEIIKSFRLKKLLGLKKGDFFNEYQLKAGLEKILNYAKENGLPEAKIDYATSYYRDKTKLEILVKIEEGKRVKIEDVVFKGNKRYSKEFLVRNLKISREFWYKESLVKKIEEKIVAFYKERGFCFVGVSSEIIKDKFLLVNIEEGICFKIKSIDLCGNVAIPTRQLLGVLPIKEGVPFDISVIKKANIAISGVYYKSGYIFSEVQEIICYDFDKNTVDIIFKINEGTKAYIEDIKIVGNEKTKDYVIKRELLIKKGEVFDTEKITLSRYKLMQLDYFEDVSIDVEEGKKPNRQILVIKVKEKQTNMGMASFGYRSKVGLVGSIETKLNNLFGRGYAASIKAEFGEKKYTNYELYFKNPWLFNKPARLEAGVWDTTQERPGYMEKNAGFSTDLGRKIGNFTEISAKYKYNKENLYDIDESAPADIKQEAGSKRISSISIALTQDTREAIFFPTGGHRFILANMIGTKFLGGEVLFHKPILDISFYKKIFWGLIFCQHIELSLLRSIEGGRVPATERFYLGGPDTIRGYEEESIHPYDRDGRPIGGNSMFISNTEIRLPLDKRFTFAIFYDMGNSYRTTSIDLTDVLSSLGFSFCINIAIAPIRIDYAYNLSQIKGNPKGVWKLHFSFGPKF